MRALIIILILILGLASINAEMTGGGGFSIQITDCNSADICEGDFICNTTSGQCQIDPSSFTGCLIKNCDYFCKSEGMSFGRYYEGSKCLCEKYSDTAHGKIMSYDFRIEVKECSFRKSFRYTELIIALLVISFLVFALIYPHYQKKKKKERQ